MVNLLIDAGNTSIKLAVYADDTISDEVRCDENSLPGCVDGLRGLFGDFDVAAVSDVRGMGEDTYNYIESVCGKLVKVKGDSKEFVRYASYIGCRQDLCKCGCT